MCYFFGAFILRDILEEIQLQYALFFARDFAQDFQDSNLAEIHSYEPSPLWNAPWIALVSTTNKYST
jgi:hypothetical protein